MCSQCIELFVITQPEGSASIRLNLSESQYHQSVGLERDDIHVRLRTHLQIYQGRRSSYIVLIPIK